MLPLDDRDGHIWIDGTLMPWRDAKVHVLTHGLHYASAVFEGERVYDGATFKLTEHSQRLADSADVLGFKLPYSVDAIDAATRQVVEANSIVSGYVRPVAWRGSEMMGVSAQRNTIHVAIAAWDWGSYFDPADARMKRHSPEAIADYCRRPASRRTAPTKAKAAGLYMICTLVQTQGRERPAMHDALML